MKKMKMNNKGFSLVELIIVIAIMAILAGALAPALIKYVGNSRRSTDVSNAKAIQSAMSSALSDETAFAAATDKTAWEVLPSSGSDDYWKLVDSNLSGGLANFQSVKSTKTAKCTNGNSNAAISNGKYYYKLDTGSSNVEIAVGAGDNYYLVYPTACAEMGGVDDADNIGAEKSIIGADAE